MEPLIHGSANSSIDEGNDDDASSIWFPLIVVLSKNFAKSLLDVVDNLGRASSVVKGRKDSSGAIPFLKTLPEVAGMTEKQLMEVFNLDIRYMIEFYDQPRFWSWGRQEKGYLPKV
ncbi:protein GrpE-like [Cucumis melo var. makuwa]|uniref:Protein GrpE-like n=1 Tax=Cucumis melo var. makuwa TaxID=1194695 RepID=A0A5D3DHG0_CUCMM|nr:protein GrpE-like [Cucumis melo var. makuwa]TYK23054.1 protein GrpE-like [Cucumis melo var. makuwa]